MKNLTCLLVLGLASAGANAVIITVGPWQPIYKGVELADGRQQAETTGEFEQRALCLRIDLSDPDIELFTTPKCTNCGTYETLSENTSHFLEQYGLQAAVNGAFYASSTGPNDVPLGTPEDVFGLAICQGTVVSLANRPGYSATLLFTTNNQAFYLPTNSPPGTNTAGLYTAVSGSRPLLVHGLNVQTPNPSDRDPRTGMGLSEDRQYLFLLTIDGRQPQNGPGWSNGADFYDTGEWLKRFGAWDGINLDGGGSTTMSIADCQGKAVRLNRPSFVAAYGRERIIGHNVGLYAKPLPNDLKDLTVLPGSTTAIITWRTELASTTQAEYGPTSSYGSASAFDPRLVKKHVVTLSGLAQGSNYFFRALSATETGQTNTLSCSFATSRSIITTQLFGLTNAWVYSTNNLDNEPLWKTPGYDDSTWFGPGLGCLHIENSTPPAGNSFPPRNTLLPPGGVSPIFRTYYFRTHFNFSGAFDGLSLLFSNYVDDGAVFYLNGTEIYRLRMPAAPASILNSTYASSLPCVGQPQVGSGDALAICPDVFTISGDLVSLLVQGENVVAVEVHNYTSGADILFGSALIANQPALVRPELHLWMEDNLVTLFWNGEDLTLQQTSDLGSQAYWSDVPGPVTESPFTVPVGGTRFYRLRN